MQRRHERGEERAHLFAATSAVVRAAHESRANSIRRGIHGGERGYGASRPRARAATPSSRASCASILAAAASASRTAAITSRACSIIRERVRRWVFDGDLAFGGAATPRAVSMRRWSAAASATRRSMSFDTGTCARTARARGPRRSPRRRDGTSPRPGTNHALALVPRGGGVGGGGFRLGGARRSPGPNSGEKRGHQRARQRREGSLIPLRLPPHLRCREVFRAFILTAFAAGRIVDDARESGRRDGRRGRRRRRRTGERVSPTSRAVHAAAADLRRSRTRSAASAAASRRRVRRRVGRRGQRVRPGEGDLDVQGAREAPSRGTRATELGEEAPQPGSSVQDSRAEMPRRAAWVATRAGGAGVQGAELGGDTESSSPRPRTSRGPLGTPSGTTRGAPSSPRRSPRAPTPGPASRPGRRGVV